MQRRAAAIYFVFFLVIGAGAWAYIGVAEDTQRPQFSVSGPTFENETTQAIGGTEYTVTEVVTVGGGGGHGGGGGGSLEATVVWTNESSLHTASIENDSIIPYEGDEYRVHVANQTNVSSATLREYINVSARLTEDSEVENSLATKNDTDYVVYRENQTLVPLDDYLPERDTVELQVDDTLQHEGNETTVRAIEPSGLTVGWIAPGQEEVDLQEGANMTLANGDRYFAHFPNSHEVALVSGDQYTQYAETVDQRDYFNERLAGLWGVVIVSGLAAIFLLATSYLPTRG